MAVRLVCIDVDGTLVGTGGRIHPSVWEYSAAAREAGIRLALSSGRPGLGIALELAERLDAGGWHCFQNGASILRLEDGESRSTPLPDEPADALVTRSRETGRILELYSDSDYVVERDTPRSRAHAALLGLEYRPRPFGELQGQVVRAQWIVPHHELEQVLAEPHAGLEVSPSTAAAMPDTRFINLTRAGVDKASATRAIADSYGIPLSQVMFVGDGWNDASAMRSVGWPVAMGNAEAPALAASRHVVGDVDEGGVADALRLALKECGVAGGF